MHTTANQDASGAVLREVRGATLDVLRANIEPGTDVALLDVPNQRNVGDSLILAGELSYLRQMGCRIRYVADLYSYEPDLLRRLMPNGTVLLHGGGNFGDIWLGHQEYRERVVEGLPEYPIVQLPQSVFFTDRERARTANNLISKHPRFTLLLREGPSIDRASEQLPDLKAVFCHDMALGWNPTAVRARQRRSKAETRSKNILVIARADRESSSGLSAVPVDWIGGAHVQVRDWRNTRVLAARWHSARFLAVALRKIQGRVDAPLSMRALVNFISWWNLKQISTINIRGGLQLFSGARIAVVDRLHAHVLALLLGVDNIVLDNNYGKLESVWNSSTGRFPTAYRAKSLDEAHTIALSLLSQ